MPEPRPTIRPKPLSTFDPDSIPTVDPDPIDLGEPAAAVAIEPDPAPIPAVDDDPHLPARPAIWDESWTFDPDAADAARMRRAARRAADRQRGIPRARRRPDSARLRVARPHSGGPKVLTALGTVVCVIGAWAVLPHSGSTAQAQFSAGGYPKSATAYARAHIPPSYIALYLRAAKQYGLDWAKLAAVGQIESNHGRSPLPGVTTGTNSFGAAGPAQFLTPTWARYGVDGNGDGTISAYDPADAIPSMAAYLKASGAPGNWPGALFTYNHSYAYVSSVLALSRRFATG